MNLAALQMNNTIKQKGWKGKEPKDFKKTVFCYHI